VKRYAGKPFVVLGVNVDPDFETFQATVRSHDIPGVSLYDKTEKTPDLWEIDPTPTVFLVDADGVVRYVQVGLPTEEWLEEKIDGLLRQKK
jgi:cytochrome oxidase Cu insertion factor (SCO1/SenC/PrrC family)